jgi:hypothetical protein
MRSWRLDVSWWTPCRCRTAVMLPPRAVRRQDKTISHHMHWTPVLLELCRRTAHQPSKVTPLRLSPQKLLKTPCQERDRAGPQPPGGARCLAYPTVIDPEAPPIRPERHVENSIAAIRKRLTVALAKSLARCPCCQSTPRPPATRLRL